MHRYLKNTICNLRTPFWPWIRAHSDSLFWAFFLVMVYIFIIQKISSEWGRILVFFNICCNFGQIYHINIIKKKYICKIWVITYSKHAANITWWVYWMKNKCLLLSTFCTFQTPLTLLPYSAMADKSIVISAVLPASPMPLLNEKQGSSFAHFLYFSNPIDPLNL